VSRVKGLQWSDHPEILGSKNGERKTATLKPLKIAAKFIISNELVAPT